MRKEPATRLLHLARLFAAEPAFAARWGRALSSSPSPGILARCAGTAMAECPDNTIAGFATPAMTIARPRPIDRRTVCLAVAAGSFTAAAPWLSFADDPPPLDAVKKKVPQLETWLRDSRLGESIEVVRPHRAPHRGRGALE
jgi:hypothetical protein